MNLSSIITEETILLSLDVQSKEECIDKMAEILAKGGFVSDKGIYIESVINRETTGSTGVGFSVAIPHGKSQGVTSPGLAFARLTNPIDWNSLDGQPVSMVFLIAVPEEKAGNDHLQILIAISRKLIHEEFRNLLSNAQNPSEIMEILKSI